MAGTGRLGECPRIQSPISDMPDIGDFYTPVAASKNFFGTLSD